GMARGRMLPARRICGLCGCQGRSQRRPGQDDGGKPRPQVLPVRPARKFGRRGAGELAYLAALDRII
ncbi:hypothetical protein, partial [Endobacter medicaginis]|uniref:hypothetical protein n=1 Tax=Endobacter medicaginis TaxID=1181271 RepID=UPI001C3FFC8B